MSSEQQNFHPDFGEGQINDEVDLLEVPFHGSGKGRSPEDKETKKGSENKNNLL